MLRITDRNIKVILRVSDHVRVAVLIVTCVLDAKADVAVFPGDGTTSYDVLDDGALHDVRFLLLFVYHLDVDGSLEGTTDNVTLLLQPVLHSLHLILHYPHPMLLLHCTLGDNVDVL